MSHRAPAEETVQRLLASSGALAELWKRPAGDVIAVKDARGRLVLELRETEGRAILYVPDGDLELRASGRVRIHGGEGVDIEGREVRVRATHLHTVAAVVETHANRVLEKAKNVYRDVEGLHRVRAKHVRFTAKEAFRAVTKRIRLRAKKDAKIDGEKIYLG